jgi:hypothetical protein
MDHLEPFELEQLIKCVRRELAFRRAAYAKWVAAGRMKQDNADAEIRLMARVVEVLEGLQQERLL